MRTLRVAAVVLGLALVAAPAHATVGSRAAAPAPLLPTLPPQLAPVTEAVSPLVWQACRAVGLVIGLTEVAGTLAGIPPATTTSINDVVAAATGPMLTVFFEVCQQIPLPDDPPTCAVDAQVPALPYLGQPVPVAGLLANELRALDATFEKLGVPLHGALSDAADDLLGCAAGHDPAPTSPTTVSPSSPASGPTPMPEVRLPSIAGSSLDIPAGAGVTGAPVAPRGGTVGAALPGTRPVSSSGSEDGRGMAMGLVALAAVAAATWRFAGRPRGATP